MNYMPSVHDCNNQECQQKARELLHPSTKKVVQDAITQIVDDEFNRLEDYAGEFLSDVAARRAEAFLRAVLDGDPKAGAELISAGGRYRSNGVDKGKPWARVIHGRLFEVDEIELRRKLVEAHRDLIADERIADLESIVDGLTRQIRKLEDECERLRRA